MSTTGTDHATAAEAERLFPCDACGAAMRFDPGRGMLVCSHCGTEQETSGGPWRRATIRELDFEAARARTLPEIEQEETRVLSCTNCGARVEFEPGLHAAECPFCATPVVTGAATDRHIKPRAVLPFLLDEPAAHEAMETWFGRLWFAPSGLKDYARRGRKMTGIYVPHWTFDADTKSAYHGERGTVYYETRTVTRDGKRQTVRVAKVRWTPKSGRVARFFDDVLVLASRSLPESFARALPPWDLAALEPYNPEYLAGFRAEAYTIGLEEAWDDARARMDRTIERDVRFDIGGDRQRVHRIDTDVSGITFKHVLLPVWVAAYRYRGRSFRFLVNGQTGRVQGERPYSGWKIALAVALGLLAASTVGYLIAVSEGMAPAPGGF
ncbi:primosomal protein N' (replication factor Y) - superfamily II helicase [Rhodovulum sp. 12E13]|uniref:primosomal protein N' (replication factor Y) - superfamily II helicase n=1 Tax=Rhodovulum sp. 12E13 TaxID=2203891 RepID=UPI000E19F3C0|nr:primosomal protein N' (replication factor Y) - superfamily II helicase [Rhodovulum sp. 12E13]RDC72591.1 primosomal protein N' (replication factor Y) - superfamily II helicase [Rhodovulum sp. 12E13]